MMVDIDASMCPQIIFDLPSCNLSVCCTFLVADLGSYTSMDESVNGEEGGGEENKGSCSIRM